MTAYTTQQIAQRVGGTLDGPGDVSITGVEQIDCAQAGALTFIGHKRFAGAWADCQASAALISQHIALEATAGRALIRVEDADLAMALVLEMFAPALPGPHVGIDPTACIDDSATLGREVAIGPGCVIAKNVRIGDKTVLHAHVCIYDETEIGADCVIWPQCVIRERCSIGDGSILHPHVVIGADGFGYRPAPDGQGLVKVAQIGTVRIGHDVEIGAGSCVDRGKFSATVIGDGTKIDNLCQIGHNCQIGRGVVIAALTGISGSVTIGDGAILAGQVGIADHLTIGAGARLGAKAGVARDVPPGVTWTGYPAGDIREVKRQWIAMQKLPELVKITRKLRRG